MRVQYIFKAEVLTVAFAPDYRDGVTDGDTMRFQVDLGFRIYPQFNFRIKDFNAPELYRPFNEAELEHAKQADAYAGGLLIGKVVTIQTFKDPAVWNRYEAVITLPDGRDFAAVMTEAGMARRESY